MSAPRPRGRRPGGPDTRAAILAAAGELFAERGYDATAVRAIAERAGVDAALVHHYFGTKSQLLVEATRLPIDPREILADVLDAGTDRVGERLVAAVLGVWDDPEHQTRLVAALRRMLAPGGERLLGEGVLPALIGPALRRVVPDRPEERIALVAGQVFGLLASRYLLGVEPVASAPAETLAAQVGPTVQRYLREPLD